MTLLVSLFFYNVIGDGMKVYIDALLIYNFIVDFLLLMSVATILKRRVSFYRLGLGAFIGSFSILLLFFPFTTIMLIVLKLLVSIIMIVISFGYHNIKIFFKNLGYLYFVSMLLGGGVYLWNSTFSLNNDRLSFISNSYQLNFIGLLIISPILIAYYVRKMRTLAEQYQYYYLTSICYKNNILEGIGYIDSGNTLTCKRKPVILVSSATTHFNIEEFTLLPYQSLNHTGVLKCFPADFILLEGHKWEGVYIGIMETDINIDGVDFLLHREMLKVMI